MTHPAIRELFQALGRNAAFQDLVRKLPQGGAHSLSGLTDTAKALYLILLGQLTGRQIFLVTDGAKQAELLAELCQTFFDLLVTARGESGNPILIPALDVLPFQGLSPHSEISEQRAAGLIRLATGRAPLVIAPIGAALLRTGAPSFYRQLTLSLKVGEEIAMDDMVSHLLSIGYQRREPVEMVGEFSVRGGIVDVFPAEAEKPIRIEMFGDLIESVRRFDVETQRSVLKLDQTSILPLVESPKPPGAPNGWEFAAALQSPMPSSMFAMAEKAIIVLDEPEQINQAAERFWKRLEEALGRDNLPHGVTADVLYRNATTGDTGFYQMSNGAVQSWVSIGGSSATYAVVGIGDFNGDGTSDILFRNSTTGDTGFYQMSRGALEGWHRIGGSSAAYEVVGTGDYNGDGTSDVLFRNSTNGDMGYYQMQNGVLQGWHAIGGTSTAYGVWNDGGLNAGGSVSPPGVSPAGAAPVAVTPALIPTPDHLWA